ncbi:potassium channel subfamily K member 3-like [Hetaerina americana]|uniref:potassium channel subfamily K member 3-like n=1 Tax=Hetaerina americana TaxID=62018 RepID=UPI003A7F0F43
MLLLALSGRTASAGAAAEYREKLRTLSPGDEDLKSGGPVAGALEDGSAAQSAATACCSSASSAASPSAASSSSSCGTSPSASHASIARGAAPGCVRSLGIAAPLLLCLAAVVLYVAAGAAVLSRWERWPFLDAAYFCFMSLSTIGFGDLVPGGEDPALIHGLPGGVHMGTGNATIWFVSLYILTGMALTATCFNILHDEIMQRLKHKYPSDAPALHAKSSGSSSGVGGGGVVVGGGGVVGGGAASSTTTAVSTSSSARKEGDEDPYS